MNRSCAGDGRTGRRLGVVGLDLVRDRDGELRTLEDNTRTPSGFAYAVAACDGVTATLDALAPTLGVRTPAPIPLEPATVAALPATLWDAAAAIGRGAAADASAGPNVVVLTSGPGGSAFLEHATAARWLAAPLVTLEQLQQRGNELWLRAGEAGPACRVDAVYRRTDTDLLRDEHGALTAVAELLLVPWLAGRLAVVNGFGTGVADDKLVHAYIEEMIRFYLCEEPLMRSVETIDLNHPVALE
jgi:uncharacterized circularly permuted ATP-grasp superfamily protein